LSRLIRFFGFQSFPNFVNKYCSKLIFYNEQIFKEKHRKIWKNGFERWRNPLFEGIMDKPDAMEVLQAPWRFFLRFF